MARTAAVILAAGGSTRMGRPKQLLHFEGKPLILHATLCAQAAGCTAIFVILGNEAPACTAALAGTRCELISNGEWQTGISSSIRLGTEACEADPGIDALLLLLVDQPTIPPSHLRELVESQTLAATAFHGAFGPPALFPRKYFKELQELQGDTGGKAILKRHADEVRLIECLDAAADWDTPSDIPSNSPVEA